jgi:ribose 5-phosphate isomerase B
MWVLPSKDMKIALASDHAGYDEKEKVKETLDQLGIQYEDFGTTSTDSVDYPDYARKVGEAVSSGEFEQGMLVCGSGTGMAIVANKVPGVRAAVAWTPEIARLARQHNNANVLSLAARFTPDDQVKEIIKAWFEADFEAGRHEGRVQKISEIEKGESRKNC